MFTKEDVKISGGILDGYNTTFELHVWVSTKKLVEIGVNGFEEFMHDLEQENSFSKTGTIELQRLMPINAGKLFQKYTKNVFANKKYLRDNIFVFPENSKIVEVVERYPLECLKKFASNFKKKNIGYCSQINLIKFLKNNGISYLCERPLSNEEMQFQYAIYKKRKNFSNVAEYIYFNPINASYVIRIL